MIPSKGFVPIGDKLYWRIPDRSDRRLLVATLLALAGSMVVFAALSQEVLSGVLGLVLPSSGGGTVRETLLQRHRILCGAAASGIFLLVWSLPTWYKVVGEVTRAFTRPRTWMFLTCLIALIVVTRVALSGRMLPIIPGQDTGHYFQLASTLLEEGRYIEYASHSNEPSGFRAWRPPGFPFALAGAMGLFGRGTGAVLLTNTLWTIILVLSIYFLVRKLGTEGQARIAALACAFYPSLVQSNFGAMSELQYASLTALGVCCLFGIDWKRSAAWAFGGGAVLGLAALTRGNGLLLWLMLLVAYPVYLKSSHGQESEIMRRLLLRTSFVAAGFLLAIAPWMARNLIVLGEWIPVATSGGANMWLGHNPGSDGLLRADTRPEFPMPPDELVWSEYGFRNALRYWISHPVENIKTAARIVAEIIKVDNGALGLIFQQEGRASPRWLFLALWGGFNLLYYAVWFCAGFWLVARATGRWVASAKPGILLFVAIAYILTYVPFIGWGRYKIPALPFLVAVACMVVVGLAMPKVHDAAGRSANSVEKVGAESM